MECGFLCNMENKNNYRIDFDEMVSDVEISGTTIKVGDTVRKYYLYENDVIVKRFIVEKSLWDQIDFSIEERMIKNYIMSKKS